MSQLVFISTFNCNECNNRLVRLNDNDLYCPYCSRSYEIKSVDVKTQFPRLRSKNTWYKPRLYMERIMNELEKKHNLEIPMKRELISLFNNVCNRFQYINEIKYFPSYRFFLYKFLIELGYSDIAQFVSITKN